ncbi:hypothetical protein G4D42_06310 [Burkholderia pseudomallei]|uniref:hypothetical protein n=1 Tax=Burkholderia pseudomallei TaxID=28450 RepID=UPI001592EBDC|nr:hypothetical protein [Burkholderia pseudomallei]NVI23069.1 hypothetical protein [Burkholderia pseudomallei]
MSAVKAVVVVSVGIVAIILFVALLPRPGESPEQLDARKRECANAIMSSVDTSTRNYTDKAAYEANVREHCHGLEMSGVPLDK